MPPDPPFLLFSRISCFPLLAFLYLFPLHFLLWFQTALADAVLIAYITFGISFVKDDFSPHQPPHRVSSRNQAVKLVKGSPAYGVTLFSVSIGPISPPETKNSCQIQSLPLQPEFGEQHLDRVLDRHIGHVL
ncbi:hypothetical protein B0H63DRAFT_211491 [Podospora didyma]|uniref:Uncharacterized protein n=1 Tax=Podospora didyma TaxID=330526 RepID=A0AAE0NHJ3_9PEZI|nr:hypothetical protein B0H63DRAFT_211491 [Podospora didyma]